MSGAGSVLRAGVAASRNRFVQLGVVLVAVALMGRAVYRSREEVADGIARIGLGTFVVATVVFTIGVWLAGMAWRRILVGFGQRVGVIVALRVFSASQLGKYVPGSVWVALMVMEFGRRHGLNRQSVGLSVAVAGALGALAGVIVGLPAVPLAVSSTDDIPWGWLVLSTPLLFALWPGAVNWIINRGLRAVGRPPLSQSLDGRTVGLAMLWAVMSYLVQGLHLVVLTDAVHDGSVNPAILISGFALAWTVGFLFLPAPAGAGIREAVLIGVLSTQVGEGEAVAIALISRGVTIVADLVLTGIGLGSMGIRDRRTVSRPPASTS